jgi:uncharacterized protein YbjQ (UPF0145 family)
MFESLKEGLKRAAEENKRAREESERLARAKKAQLEAEAAAASARERKITGIRIITGEVKYRYAILDTLRVFAQYIAEPGEPYDPTASSAKATRLMQELAYSSGADAVIHAQYQIVRYSTSTQGYTNVPVYETHLFGTAVKIIGPPADWEEEKSD